MTLSTEQRGMRAAVRFFEARGDTVRVVDRDPKHRGCDLLVRRGHRLLRVEVKGCTRPWQIPDLYESEFDGRRRLIADFLCVVYLIGARRPQICLIPRKAIPPAYIETLTRYRITSRFKKESVLGQFMQR